MSCLVFAITLAASPLAALGDYIYGGDTYFNKSDFVRHVVRIMVPYWYVKTKMKDRSIRSFCYFDPKVENSIGCSGDLEAMPVKTTTKARTQRKIVVNGTVVQNAFSSGRTGN